MVPIKTSIEDMQKLVGYLSKQVGWIEASKVEKALGVTATDDRKISAVVALGLVQRDGSNLKVTPRGQMFQMDQAHALRDALHEFELYRSTVEWLRYQSKSQATAVEIGQYWENSHSDTLGGLRGTTLKAGAVCFGRIVEGAGLGTFLIGRGGKETRLEVDQAAVAQFVDGEHIPGVTGGSGISEAPVAPSSDGASATPAQPQVLPPRPASEHPTVSVSASPNAHVNVEIHIAADATADTVREIFRNMARYVLDRPVDDDS